MVPCPLLVRNDEELIPPQANPRTPSPASFDVGGTNSTHRLEELSPSNNGKE